MIHFRKQIVDRVILLAIGLVVTLGVAIDWSIQGRFDHSGDRLGNIVSNLQLMLILQRTIIDSNACCCYTY